MKTILPQSRFLVFVFLIANMFLANVAFGQTVTLDQVDLDYAPGETVYITGTGWQPGETVGLEIDNLTNPNIDCGPVTPQPHELWTVVADENGNFTASWYVNTCELGADLLLGALGQTSGFTYEVFFTDGNIRVQTNAGTISLTSVFYSISNTCSGTGALPASTTVGSSNVNIGAATETQSFTLTAPSFNSLGGQFTSWSGPAGFTSNSLSICAPGSSNPGNLSYIANYAACVSPTSLTYTSNTVTYCPNVAISANSPSNNGGAPTSYSVSPTLPAGLSLNITTGVITGTPTTATAAANYTVTATNSCGNTTRVVNITVNALPSLPTAGSNTYIYNGTPRTATANVGAGETVDWYAAATGSATATAPNATNTGSYIAYAEARNTTTGCVSATRTLVTLTINKATPTATLAVNNSPVTYTGLAQSATVGITTSSVPGTVSSILTGGAATQTSAGTYAVSASFVPTDSANYNTLTGLSAGNFVINKATPTATLSVNNSPVTYTGLAQSATVGITTSSVPGAVSSILTGGSATQTSAGTYAVIASFVPTDSANYNTLTGLSAGNFVINKAPSITTVTVAAGPHIYTGSAIAPASVTVTGAGGLSLTLAAVYVNNVNAGTANASYTYAGDANHGVSSDSEDFVINKADAVVTVTGYTGTYDAASHGATGTVTGVAGDLSAAGSSLDLGASFTAVPGGTASWTFTGGTNYKDQSGTAAIVINKASSTTVVTINGGPFTYTGSAQTPATVSVTGAGGLSLTPDPVYTNNINAGTANASYSYAGDANHEPSSDSENFTIGKANTTVSATGGTFNFDNNTHAATAYAIGIGGVHITSPFTFSYVGTNCAGAYNSASAPSAPGTYTATATFGGNANYNGSLSTASITIISTLSATIETNKPNLYFGFSGGDAATITVKPTGGQGPYRVEITMVNPLPAVTPRPIERVGGKLICDYINAAGDETWTSVGATYQTIASCNVAPKSISSNPSSTSFNNIPSNGSYSVNVTLLTDARFVATVVDANGCSYTIPQSVGVDAEDARCFAGNSGVAKVALCHQTGSAKNPCTAICVDQSAVQEHLNHGDFLGKCTNDCKPPKSNAKQLGEDKTLIEVTNVEPAEFKIIAYPNPSNYQFTLEIKNGSQDKVEVLIYDMSARLIRRIEKVNVSNITFGENLPRGEYLVLVRQGENQKSVNVIKK